MFDSQQTEQVEKSIGRAHSEPASWLLCSLHFQILLIVFYFLFLFSSSADHGFEMKLSLRFSVSTFFKYYFRLILSIVVVFVSNFLPSSYLKFMKELKN